MFVFGDICFITLSLITLHIVLDFFQIVFYMLLGVNFPFYYLLNFPLVILLLNLSFKLELMFRDFFLWEAHVFWMDPYREILNFWLPRSLWSH